MIKNIKSRRHRGALFLAAIMVVMAAYGATLLAAGGPVLSDFNPAPGLAITRNTSHFLDVSVKAADVDGINSQSVILKFNGVHASNLTVTFREVGHWEECEDTCMGPILTWVVDEVDETEAVISGRFFVVPNSLPDINTVEVSAGDKAGNVSTASWPLTYHRPPVFSQLLPAHGTQLTTKLPSISAKITDTGGISAATVEMYLDGVKVNSAFNQSTGVICYDPVVPVFGGNKLVTVNARDMAGNLGTQHWTFTILDGSAEFLGESPAGASTVSVANPRISFVIDDQTDLVKSTLTMMVNGAKVTPAYTIPLVGGHWEEDTCMGETIYVWVNDYDKTVANISYSPAVLPDGVNNVVVSIANTAGGVSSYSWSFFVQAPPKVTNPFPVNVLVNTQQPLIGAKVTDNGMVAGARMTVGGVEIPVIISGDTVSGRPATALDNDREHTVNLTVTDGVGAATAISWKFTVQTYQEMSISSNCTDCHAGYPVPNHPMSNCSACHNGLNINDPIEDCRICHGTYPHGPDFLTMYNGHFFWDNTCTWCHNSGYRGRIPEHSDVSSLHVTSTEMESCSPCHLLSLTREHYRYPDESGNPLGCYTCHRSSNNKVTGAIAAGESNCDACHDLFSSEGHSAQHIVSYGEKCVSCHGDNMMSEQVYHKGDCKGCHSNPAARIKSAIRLQNRTCFGCHEEPHGMKMAVVREDIPLYSAITWSVPDPAVVWRSEGWLPAQLDNDMASVLFSKRAVLDPAQVYSYYRTEMTRLGWSKLEDSGEGETFRLLYRKGRRHCMIWLYSGKTPLSGTSEKSRVLIVYN